MNRREQVGRLRDRAVVELARRALQLETSLAGLRRRVARIDDIEIVYLEGGSGEPLVLVHGIGGSKENFVRVAGRLTRSFRLIVPDLPGFGESSRLPIERGYSIEQQARRLHRFVQKVAHGPVHLGGNSMGGWISMEYAGLFPEDVRSLWLLAPAGIGEAETSEMLLRFADSGLSDLFAQTTEDFERILDLVFERRPYVPGFVTSLLAARAAKDHDLHQAVFQQMLDNPAIETRFPALPQPALIVWGQEDRVLHPSGCALTGRLFSQCEERILSGIGHVPMLEAPRLCVRDYLLFRGQLAGARDLTR